MINQNFKKEIFTLNSENVAQDFVRLARHFLPATFCFKEGEIFQLKALKAKEILSGKQMRVREKSKS